MGRVSSRVTGFNVTNKSGTFLACQCKIFCTFFARDFKIGHYGRLEDQPSDSKNVAKTKSRKGGCGHGEK